MVWSYDDDHWISGDDGGTIKYWKSNMKNEQVNTSAHQESVRDLSFCRTNLKFCSCSDDTKVKIWDYERCQEQKTLIGHGWNVTSVDWHPTKSLASGGRDSVIKLWDARSGRELCSFYDHKSWVQSVKWNQNGNRLLTASKSQAIRLYDIRSMKELETFTAHRNEKTTALVWHPSHEEYFVSGSSDGSIYHWIFREETPQVEIPNAHNSSNNNSVWDLQWHPVGRMLCSGSNDFTTKFWCRNSPGDKSNISQNQSIGVQNFGFSCNMTNNFPFGPFYEGKPTIATQNKGTIIPGVGTVV